MVRPLARAFGGAGSLIALVAVACGGHVGSSPQGNSASGSVAGVALDPQSAVAIVGVEDGFADFGPDASQSSMLTNAVNIDIWNVANTCTTVHSQNKTLLSIEIGGPGPGTYPVNSPPAEGQATATFFVTGENCISSPVPLEQRASGGVIVVTSASASSISGTFELTFPGGELSGSFDAVVCDALIEETDAGVPICMP